MHYSYFMLSPSKTINFIKWINNQECCVTQTTHNLTWEPQILRSPSALYIIEYILCLKLLLLVDIIWSCLPGIFWCSSLLHCGVWICRHTPSLHSVVTSPNEWPALHTRWGTLSPKHMFLFLYIGKAPGHLNTWFYCKYW